MLRMQALAVLLITFSATAAHGGDKPPPSPAASSEAADLRASPSQISHPRAIDLRVPSALAWAQPLLRGAVSSGGKRRQTGAAISSRQPVPPARGGILGVSGDWPATAPGRLWPIPLAIDSRWTSAIVPWTSRM
jgi:hypothetical protein